MQNKEMAVQRGPWMGAGSCGDGEAFWGAGRWGPEPGNCGNMLSLSQGKNREERIAGVVEWVCRRRWVEGRGRWLPQLSRQEVTVAGDQNDSIRGAGSRLTGVWRSVEAKLMAYRRIGFSQGGWKWVQSNRRTPRSGEGRIQLHLGSLCCLL